MAFLKYARAHVVKPFITVADWDQLRHANVSGVGPYRELSRTAAGQVILQEYNPDQFLLSHCFPPGHKVLMGDGTEKSIEAVRVGDLVVTHAGNVKPVTAVLSREVDEELTVLKAASLPEVMCTGEHPFYVIREGSSWCRVSPSYSGSVKCTFGGNRVCLKHWCRTNGAVPDWLPANQVACGDRTYTPTLHVTSISSDLNPNRMRLLGYYVAGGHVDRDDHPCMVRFAINESEVSTLGAEIAALMRLEFGIETHSTIHNHKSNKGVTFSFQSFEAASWFLAHAGFGSRTKRLSMAVVHAPTAWQQRLMGAWLNGAGCWDDSEVRLVAASNDLASQAVLILDRLGVHSYLTRVRKPGPFNGWRVCIASSYVALLAGHVQWDVQPNAHKELPTKGRYRYAASTLSVVERITKRAFRGTVYNLSVADDESYVINRQAVHNCTIIASVDTEESPEPLGKQIVDGVQIDRRFADWQVTPGTVKYINNNNDCWERKLLLSTFKTFIGGENYVEHIQIPELSKGKIIDAASRDIGDSVYVDILVATDKRHAPLIDAITSGRLQTLSMGCFLPGTPVTMADGTRVPIEEVAPGDMVLTHKGRARKVLNKQVRDGRWGMRRISVAGMSDDIEATDNHPFFVLRPAKRSKRGHDKRLPNPNRTYSLEEARQMRLANAQAFQVEQVRADGLAVGDYVIFPRLDVVTSSDPGVPKARLLGYFLAEGSFLKHKGVPVEVRFNFSLEEKHSFVAETVRLLQEAFPGSQPWTQDQPNRNACTVHVTGRELVEWFFRHSGEYSYRKRLSADVMAWSAESHQALLEAWLNGNGYHRADGLSVGTVTSYDLACQLHLLAIRCGIPVRMEYSYRGQTATVAIVNGEAFRHEVTGRITSFNLCFPQFGAQTEDRHLRVLDNMVIAPITNIKQFSYSGLVHNMEVEEDNSYQVHGVATHNCQVAFTICTKCGNVAEDEAQLCSHIRYMKGNEFYDALGNKRKIAELCGHIKAEPGSVKFIEASWVANPAFTGAVLRSILQPSQTPGIGERIQVAFSEPTRVADPTRLQKAARQMSPTHSRTVVSADFDFEQDSPGQAPATDSEKEEDPFDKVVTELVNVLREKAVGKLREQIGKSDRAHDTRENQNNTLVREACKYPEWRRIASIVLKHTPTPTAARRMVVGLILYKRGGWSAVQLYSDLSKREMLALSRFIDRLSSKTTMAGEGRVYRAIVATGGPSLYPDLATYIEACAKHMGRVPNQSEIKALVLKGRVYECGY